MRFLPTRYVYTRRGLCLFRSSMPESAVEEASASSAPFDEMAHELIRFARDGQLAECKRLLREAPDVPLLLGFCDGCWSALAWASSEGHLEIVTLLLDHGAAEALISSPADADEPLTTPLHWAAFEGHLRIVWLLLVRGFPPNIPDSEQNTALHLAATGGHADILKTLLSVGAHASAKNTYGNTALQLTKPSSECRELLYAAAKASQDGRRFLCTCSGEFVAEVDSVHSIVVDRTSKPTPRPVRYSSHCYGRIQAAERELHAQTQNAPVGTDTAALAAAIASAERIGAAVGLIDTATAALLRLEARLDMGARAAEVDALRPLETAAPTTLLLESVSLARERGVELKLVENAEQLIRVAQAELVLRECTERCMPHQMVDDPEMQLGPAADSELATRAEAAVEELADALQGVKTLEPRKHLVAEGERVYRKLCAEAQLRRWTLALHLQDSHHCTLTPLHTHTTAHSHCHEALGTGTPSYLTIPNAALLPTPEAPRWPLIHSSYDSTGPWPCQRRSQRKTSS